MLTRSTHRPPTTSKLAKAEYRKFGPRISTQEARQFERSAELYQRAQKIKDAEKRRKETKEKRLKREAREREARHRMGIPTPRVAIARSQIPLEGFLRPMKQEQKESSQKSQDSARSSEPWTDDDLDDAELMSVAATSSPQKPVVKEEPRPTLAVAGFTASDSLEKSMGKEEVKPILPVSTINSSDARIRLQLENAWEDFMTSNTQIEREITVDAKPHASGKTTAMDSLLSVLSSQDFSFTEDDLEELGIVGGRKATSAPPIPPQTTESKKEIDRKLMPPPPPPLATKIKPISVSSVPASSQRGVTDPEAWPCDFGLSTQDLCEVEF